MAVLPMSRVNIFGLLKDRKKILETLQRLGVIDVKPFDGGDGFEKIETAVFQARFQKAKAECEQALEILDRYSPEEKSMFSSLMGLERMSSAEYESRIKRRDEILGKASELVRLEKEISDLKAEAINLSSNIEALGPWKALDISMRFSGTKKTSAFLGTFSESYDESALNLYFAESCEKKNALELKENVHFEIVSKSENQTCVMVVCLKELANRCEEILRYMGLVAPVVNVDGKPAEKITEFEKRIKKANEQAEEDKGKILKLSAFRGELKFIVDYFDMRIDKYQVIERLGHSKRVFGLTGYLPKSDTENLAESLTGEVDVAVEFTDADGDDVPVALKNNGFAAPLEGVLETFSLPGRGEVDPTSAMAVFYYFLFGLMLSDAAYGFLMVLLCGFALWKFPRMKQGMKKSLKMFLYCGISTTFWGVMFGGYFGDAIQVIAKTFFDKEIVIRPLWFSPMDEPMRMLVFSLLVGIIHLFAGLGMKFYSLARTKQWKDAIYDVIFWYMLVGGAIVYLLSMQMFVDMASLNFILSPSAGKIAALVAVLGAIGIALTAGRSSKNPAKRLAKGLYELYGVTSYLSDILSYSRLLALGLATGVIANVFNKMGSMFGGGILGAIAFTIVFVVGHTLNIGINLLGAYVHTNRLQFVEFFGKFYDGGGEKYAPFRADTAYFEMENK
ncbi:MAG: V-type ATP synthase subunit I [Clostridia bacterium]|nr:V-type ATP synthase subunit I [Clostridia bacterium]